MAEPSSDPRTHHIPCNYCGSDAYILVYPATRAQFASEEEWLAYRCTSPSYGVHGQIVRCNSCGLIYTNPRREQARLIENYATVEDPLYVEESEGRRLTFRHHLRHLERFSGVGAGRRLLDVGAYIGVFVEVANEAGWDAWGLEPSTWAARWACERGLQVIEGALPGAENELEPASFSAVTMWDVIEHVPDPMGVFEATYTLLEPGGWIAVHTMDVDSLLARLMRRRWPWLMEMHIYYFSRRTLRMMLEKAGFEVVSLKPEGRYLRLKYLITRLEPYSPFVAQLVERAARLLGILNVAVPINFGDLVTAYARKPTG